MTREEAINKLAHIIFDAAKGGYIPFNVDGEYCAMSIARAKINEFLSPSGDTVELPIHNLDEAAWKYGIDNQMGIATQSEKVNAFKAGAQWQKQQNTIKAKDVDLEEEYKNFVMDDPVLNAFDGMGMILARRFYELGLKAKGE